MHLSLCAIKLRYCCSQSVAVLSRSVGGIRVLLWAFQLDIIGLNQAVARIVQLAMQLQKRLASACLLDMSHKQESNGVAAVLHVHDTGEPVQGMLQNI